jgi:hypothetical protein
VIGASPDGVLECECCGRGTLELKCPLCLEEGKELTDLKYFRVNDGKLQLIEEHPYYYQCQLQMLCTSTEYADFFVWSLQEDKRHFERIPRNDNICREIVLHSLNFFRASIIPEILGRYYSNRKVDEN